MRYTTILPFAAGLATAIVIPDDATARQLSLESPAAQQHDAEVETSVDATILNWWDALRSAPDAAVDFVNRNAHKFLDNVLDVDNIDSLLDADDAADFFGPGKPGKPGKPGRPDNGYRGRPDHHGTTNLTVYQAIQASNYTHKFAALINDFPDIVDLLNSTDTNVTAFIPIDKAFDKIPEHHGKPPKEFIQKIIEYHILPGYYPAGRVVASHTLPTTLKSEALGGRPQRLRVSLGIFGLRINFYSKVNIANLFVKNGVIHGVDSILVPPPPARRLISLFPSKFSTLELAAEKTGLLPHHGHEDPGKGNDADHTHDHDSKLTGRTIFAPTNLAFRRLGPAANAFLFNTEKGLGYLRALLKYHIVINQTLYSDAFYGVKGHAEDFLLPLTPDNEGKKGGKGGEHNGHFHVDLPTLLDDKRLSIDIARWYGFINIRINGYQNVAIEDGIARDGVVHVVNSVLIPPREHKSEGAWTEEDGDIPVEELIERLNPYLENDSVSKAKTDADASEGQVWGEL
ncbi:putative fasciclin domain family protein [Rosellinia necatrix]|uniref:Putative fasciclin domain family protein n=1 Tax=Rosellinia necatrix TaxID=77044 RepID=A0A1W2TWG6_ROSNE|nr:putative fasciclin domain family protein [Rosellinia necatrix]